jgi:hypothetical protein
VHWRLKKFIKDDPAFAAEIAELKTGIGPIHIGNSIDQNATASGHGVVNQIVGNGNVTK